MLVFPVRTDRSLEAAVQLGEVGVTTRQGQHPFLRHGALHVIVLQNDVLLQHLHSEDPLGVVEPCQHHLQPHDTEHSSLLWRSFLLHIIIVRFDL